MMQKLEIAKIILKVIMNETNKLRTNKNPKIQLLVAMSNELIGDNYDEYIKFLESANDEEVDRFIRDAGAIVSKMIQIGDLANKSNAVS